MSWGKRALWVLSAIFLIIVLCLVFRKPLLTGYAALFEVHNATKGADALVCILGGQ